MDLLVVMITRSEGEKKSMPTCMHASICMIWERMNRERGKKKRKRGKKKKEERRKKEKKKNIFDM